MAKSDLVGDDPYAPPQQLEDDQALPLAERVLSEQSMIGAILGSISAAIPSALIYAILISTQTVTFIAYILPGFIIGYTARFCGRVVEFRYRLAIGFITAIFLLLINYILQFPMGFIYASPSIVIAMSLSGRKLTRAENSALVRRDVLGS